MDPSFFNNNKVINIKGGSFNMTNVTYILDSIKAAEEMQEDIKDVTRTHADIAANLNEIKDRKRIFRLFSKVLKRSKIDICIDRLNAALEKFRLSQGVRDADAGQDILRRLHRMQKRQDLYIDQQDFHRFLGRVTSHAAYNGLARQPMPSKPIVFHGRDCLVQEISQLLCDEKTSRICILGPIGMGKTSLALATVESPNIRAKFGSRCFWVPCVAAQSPIRFLQLLCNSLRISRDSESILEDIVSELDNSAEPRLIMLDNFETPWIPVDGTQTEVSDILRRLVQINHVAVLVTMRGNDPPCADELWQTKQLGAIDRESARTLFHDIYTGSREDPDIDSLDQLVNALGCMPFAVMLMAKLGKKSRSSVKELLAEWSKSGIEIISHPTSPEDNICRSISLSVDRDFVQQNPNAVRLLEILSLLPAGTSKENLSWLAPCMKSAPSAIATLSDAALLIWGRDSKKSTTLSVLPVVQSFMSSRIPDSTRQSVHEACCQYVLDHGRRYHDPDFRRRAKALAAEDTNLRSILPIFMNLQSILPNSSYVMEVFLRFTWYRFDTHPSLEVARRTLDLAENLGEGRYIAEALCALGGTYFRLDEHHNAEEYLSRAHQFFEKLSDDPGVSRPHAECVALLANARFYCSMPLVHTLSLLRELRDKFSDGFERAHILKALGFCLFWKRHYREALEPLHEAKDIFVLMGNPTDAALSQLWMARCYHHLSQLPEALESIKGASSFIRGVNHPRFEAVIDGCYGSILISLGRPEDALSKLERSLQCSQRLAFPMMAGLNQENIGYIYMTKNEYQYAFAAYETAMKTYVEVGPGSPLAKDWEIRCKENLDMIKVKEQNPEAAISLRRYCI